MTDRRKPDPLTGGLDGCHIYPLITKNQEQPPIRRMRIFEKVFGAMEKLRVDESNRCNAKNSRKEYEKHMVYGHGRRHPNERLRKHPADLAYSTLVKYFINSDRVYNFVFPIDTKALRLHEVSWLPKEIKP